MKIYQIPSSIFVKTVVIPWSNVIDDDSKTDNYGGGIIIITIY